MSRPMSELLESNDAPEFSIEVFKALEDVSPDQDDIERVIAMLIHVDLMMHDQYLKLQKYGKQRSAWTERRAKVHVIAEMLQKIRNKDHELIRMNAEQVED